MDVAELHVSTASCRFILVKRQSSCQHPRSRNNPFSNQMSPLPSQQPNKFNAILLTWKHTHIYKTAHLWLASAVWPCSSNEMIHACEFNRIFAASLVSVLRLLMYAPFYCSALFALLWPKTQPQWNGNKLDMSKFPLSKVTNLKPCLKKHALRFMADSSCRVKTFESSMIKGKWGTERDTCMLLFRREMA